MKGLCMYMYLYIRRMDAFEQFGIVLDRELLG
jgi:hypothetical protein